MGYRVGGGSGPQGRGAHSLKQWAADTSHLAPTTAAPQKCSLFSRRLTCQGNSPGDASMPPTILPAVRQPGCKPQSARQRSPTRTPRRQDPGHAPDTFVSKSLICKASMFKDMPGPPTWLYCAKWAREPSLQLTLGRGAGGLQLQGQTDHSGPHRIHRSSPLCHHTPGSLWSHTGCPRRRRRCLDSDLRAEQNQAPALTPLRAAGVSETAFSELAQTQHENINRHEPRLGCTPCVHPQIF